MDKPGTKTAADSTTTTASLKLWIDGRGKRVVFAEADKEFIDFLFRILSLPVATVVGLIDKDAMVGSLGNLYGSVVNINDSYIRAKKEAFLKQAAMANPKIFYRCPAFQHSFHVSDNKKAHCPRCKNYMDAPVTFVNAGSDVAVAAAAAAKGLVTYMVMDDLTVMPLSTSSTFALLNKLDISVAALEEKIVHLGMNEADKLLSASLQSKNVLTEVFVKDTKSDDASPSPTALKNGRTSVKRERIN